VGWQQLPLSSLPKHLREQSGQRTILTPMPEFGFEETRMSYHTLFSPRELTL